MAIGIEGFVRRRPGSVSSDSFNVTTTGADRIIYVCQTGQENSLPSGFTCTASGLTFSKVDKWAGTGGTDSFSQITVWQAFAAVAGTYNITVGQANAYDMKVDAFAFSGHGQTAVSIDAFNHADNGVSVPLTTVATSAVAFGFLASGFDQGGAMTGYTQVGGVDGTQTQFVQYKEKTVAGSEPQTNGYGESWRISYGITWSVALGGGSPPAATSPPLFRRRTHFFKRKR